MKQPPLTKGESCVRLLRGAQGGDAAAHQAHPAAYPRSHPAPAGAASRPGAVSAGAGSAVSVHVQPLERCDVRRFALWPERTDPLPPPAAASAAPKAAAAPALSGGAAPSRPLCPRTPQPLLRKRSPAL